MPFSCLQADCKLPGLSRALGAVPTDRGVVLRVQTAKHRSGSQKTQGHYKQYRHSKRSHSQPPQKPSFREGCIWPGGMLAVVHSYQAKDAVSAHATTSNSICMHMSVPTMFVSPHGKLAGPRRRQGGQYRWGFQQGAKCFLPQQRYLYRTVNGTYLQIGQEMQEMTFRMPHRTSSAAPWLPSLPYLYRPGRVSSSAD